MIFFFDACKAVSIEVHYYSAAKPVPFDLACDWIWNKTNGTYTVFLHWRIPDFEPLKLAIAGFTVADNIIDDSKRNEGKIVTPPTEHYIQYNPRVSSVIVTLVINNNNFLPKQATSGTFVAKELPHIRNENYFFRFEVFSFLPIKLPLCQFLLKKSE